ncbi:Dps family protein [Flagellimonas sp.]|uniref:Dps family protein n=1 Tax=Flagellimonas sp. TaxID=2058762 RepID=UPI003BAB01D8
MKTNIGLTDKQREEIAEGLFPILADEFIFFSKLLHAHWNVEGPDFHSAHTYLDELYHEQLELIDSLAEYIRSIGHYVPASLKKYLELTHLTEAYEGGNNSKEYFSDLLLTLESIIINLRKNIGPFEEKYKDAGASDFVTGLMEKHEKTAWMLRAHLK